MKSHYPQPSVREASNRAGSDPNNRSCGLGRFVPNRSIAAIASLAIAYLALWQMPIPLRADHVDNPPLEGGMVHYLLSYSYGTEVPDETINDYHADMVGSYLSFEELDGITALKVSGSSSAVVPPDVYALDHLAESSHTLSIWFKPDHIPGANGTSNDFPVLMKYSYFGIRLNADGRFYARFRQDSVGMTEISSPQYQDWTKWYHLTQVVDYDQGEIHLYVDGQPIATDTFDPWYPASSTSVDWRMGYVVVGRTQWSSRGHYWDARMFDSALSETEVTEVYIDSEIDTDGNGLPDSWELHYFGATGNDPDEDFDGDGLTNLEEYLAGTNPTNPDTNQSGIWDSISLRLGLDPTFVDVTASGNPPTITLVSPENAQLLP